VTFGAVLDSFLSKLYYDMNALWICRIVGPPTTWRVPGSIWPPPDPRTAPFWPNLPAYFGGAP